MTEPDARPLREIFPTGNGHRLQRCPCCGNPTYRGRDGLHTCHNTGAHRATDNEFYRRLFEGDKTPSLSW